jgi:hypothetical protein
MGKYLNNCLVRLPDLNISCETESLTRVSECCEFEYIFMVLSFNVKKILRIG